MEHVHGCPVDARPELWAQDGYVRRAYVRAGTGASAHGTLKMAPNAACTGYSRDIRTKRICSS